MTKGRSPFLTCLLVLLFAGSLQAEWVLTNGPTRISSVAVVGSSLFAATTNGRIFLSTDDGTNWTMTNFPLTSFRITSLVASGPYLIAGTFGDGVFVTPDNGITWFEANSGLTDQGPIAAFFSRRITGRPGQPSIRA